MSELLVNLERGENRPDVVGWMMTPRPGSGIMISDDKCHRLELVNSFVIVIASVNRGIRIYSLDNWPELEKEYPGAINTIMKTYLEENRSWE